MDTEDFDTFRAFMEREHEKRRRIEGRTLLSDARSLLADVGSAIERVKVIPGGRLAALDSPFDKEATLLPSTLIRTQLRLAHHYFVAADVGSSPSLSSFVVLRVGLECAATAHWLMSARNQREGVARVVKRMWWDSMSAADMAKTADGNPDLSTLDDLRNRINAITQRIKGLDTASIVTSNREHLSSLIRKAGHALRPDEPTAMEATWMLCAGISHGNVAISAGAGYTPATIQEPTRHLVDEATYAQILFVAVGDLQAAVDLFGRRAAEPLAHRPQKPSQADDLKM